MELFNVEELMKYIDVPILSLVIYAFIQIIKQFYDISKKWLPVMCFALGMFVSLIIMGSNGQLSLSNSQAFFTALKSMIIYGSGSIVVHSLLHKSLPFIGNASNDMFGKINKNKKNKDEENGD